MPRQMARAQTIQRERIALHSSAPYMGGCFDEGRTVRNRLHEILGDMQFVPGQCEILEAGGTRKLANTVSGTGDGNGQ